MTFLFLFISLLNLNKLWGKERDLLFFWGGEEGLKWMVFVGNVFLCDKGF